MPQKKKCFVIMPVSKTKSCTAKQWTAIFKKLSRVRLDYMNSNFQEETTPVLLLSSQEHKEYVESIE